MHDDIYSEIDHHVKLLENYAFCAMASGQYVEAGVIENASALLVRLKIILKSVGVQQVNNDNQEES